MKNQHVRWVGMLCLLFLVSTPLIPGQTQGEIPVSVNKLSDKVIVLTIPHDRMDLNVTAINSKKGIVVIDTQLSPALAEKIRSKIEEEFRRKDFIFVINTHSHGDHTFGNQAFPEAVVIGHEEAPAEMKERAGTIPATIARLRAVAGQIKSALEKMDKNSEQAKTFAQMLVINEVTLKGLESGFELIPPALTFNDRMSLDLGDLRLELTYFGISHSRSDILVYCPEEALLLTGDLFASGQDLYVDSERIAQLARWKMCLETYLKPKIALKNIVSGHGKFLAVSDLSGQLDFINAKQKEYQGRESGLFALKKAYEESGMDAGLQKLREAFSRPDEYFLLHPELDQFAYRLMLKNKLDDALKMFLCLAEMFPDSYIAHDSLGEVYLRMKENELSIKHYTKSLELNENNTNARDQLQRLKEKK